MTATLNRMSQPKKSKDRHKPRRTIGIPERICLALERMGERQEAGVSEMVKRACIFFLEHHNEWPPPSPPPAPKPRG